MSIKKLKFDLILKGAVLAIVHRLFPDGIPASVNEYAKETGIAPSTFTRTAAWLWDLLPGILKKRRPGPVADPVPEKEDQHQKAIKKTR